MAKFDKKQFDTPELQEAMQAYLKGNYETAYNMFCELAGENNGRCFQRKNDTMRSACFRYGGIKELR